MGNVGIIACAFGQQGDEKHPQAGPSNKKIKHIAWQIFTIENRLGNSPMISAQWETSIGLPVAYISLLVSQFGDEETHYIETKTVLDKSIAFFKEKDVDRIVLVGHPLHLFFINLLVSTGVWKVGDLKIDHQYDGLMKTVRTIDQQVTSSRGRETPSGSLPTW
jgi:hypothetical protein